jgi:hypothetical protein
MWLLTDNQQPAFEICHLTLKIIMKTHLKDPIESAYIAALSAIAAKLPKGNKTEDRLDVALLMVHMLLTQSGQNDLNMSCITSRYSVIV